jgi:hypothetical protein
MLFSCAAKIELDRIEQSSKTSKTSRRSAAAGRLSSEDETIAARLRENLRAKGRERAVEGHLSGTRQQLCAAPSDPALSRHSKGARKPLRQQEAGSAELRAYPSSEYGCEMSVRSPGLLARVGLGSTRGLVPCMQPGQL